MRSVASIALFALTVPLCVGQVAGADAPPRTAKIATAEAPRLYTNADLERLGPAPKAPSSPVRQDDLDWPFVEAFLATEHARIAAQRSYELNRTSREGELNAQSEGFLVSPFLDVFGRRGLRPFRHRAMAAAGVDSPRVLGKVLRSGVRGKTPHRKADRIRLRMGQSRRP